MNEKSPSSDEPPKTSPSTPANRHTRLVSNLLTPEEIELLRESKRRMLEEVKEALERMRKSKTSC
jgi:HAMP domain-containing protein